MSTLRLKVAALALVSALGVTTAHAQPSLFGGRNRVDIQQTGAGNGAGVGQTGVHNNGRIVQSGASNTGQISQTGVNNSATMYQLGRSNEGSIVQNGANNTACLVQLGRGSSASITQSGDGARLGVAQNGVHTWEFAPELCDQLGGDTKMLKRSVRGAMFPPQGRLAGG